MTTRFARLSLALLLALGAATGVHAQSKGAGGAGSNAAVLPIFNNASNKLEGYLLLEPTGDSQAGARWRFGGSNELDAAFGLDAGNSLALLCNRKNGLGTALSDLINNCDLRAIDDDADGHHGSATAAFGRNGNRVGLTAGTGRATLPAWLTPGATRGNTVNVNDLTVFGQKNVGRQGTVFIAGTFAKAELIPAGDAPPELTDRWTSKTLTLGGSYGSFGANIVGHVVDAPGQPRWEGLGLGITWRTPWSGQLTVGADNLVTRGRNPFSPNSETGQDEGAVPYVRYEQDL